MKKTAIILLLAMLMSLLLTACKNDVPTPDGSDTPPAADSESTDESDSGQAPTDDDEAVLEQGGFTMVQTTYETDNRIVAKVVFDKEYMADPTGKRDNTVKLEYAISECAKDGGGVLYIPAGQYRITKTINVPLGVFICGDWQAPTESDPKYGTVILADLQDIPEGDKQDAVSKTDMPVFKLASNTGLMGLTIYYPNQDASDVMEYDYSIYFKDGSYNYTNTLKNITIINAYRGISMGANANVDRHGTHQLENIYMCALETGVEMHGSMDTGFATGIHISTDYWTEAGCGFDEKSEGAVAYARANSTGFILGDLDCDMFADISVKGSKVGIYFRNLTVTRDSAFWGNIYGIDIRSCDIGIKADQLAPGNSALIANGYVEGSVYAVQNNQPRVPLRFCNVQLSGTTEGHYLTDDSYIPEGYKFADYKTGTHYKPAERLYVPETEKYNGTFEDFGVELQRVLDSAASKGGVVYIPAGVYSIYTAVNVPEGVQLLGATPMLQRDTQWRNVTGTVLLSYVGNEAVIKLNKNAGVVGVRLWNMMTSAPEALRLLKNNTQDSRVGVPAIKGNGSGVYVTDTIIVGGFVGIDFTGCDNHVADHILGESYSSLIIAGGKDGYIGQCHANAFAPDNKINEFFDERYVTKSDWTTDTKPGLNDFQRTYRTTYRLVGAENEYVVNCGNYAARKLMSFENSSATVINVSIDTLLGTNEMFSFTSSNVNIVNAMRVFGSSLTIDGASNVKVLNRDDRKCASEAPYNSAVSRTDSADREYTGTNTQKPVLNCDTAPSSGSCTVITTGHKEGSGAWKFTNATGTLFTQEFSTPVDVSSCANSGGYLHMWIYVEDVVKFQTASDCELELTSSGKSDVQEINWSLKRYITSSGWTELYLPFDSAEVTLGNRDDTERGEFESQALNYVRLYISGAEATTYIIDDISVCMGK